MASRLAKLLALGPRGWSDLAKAQVALLRAQRQVDRLPLGRLAIRGSEANGAPSGDPTRARALGAAIERAAAHGLIRPKCLVCSLALRDLLRQHGIYGSEIRVGVQRHRGKFLAHAWVRWGEEILGDRADHVASFTEVEDIRVLSSA